MELFTCVYINSRFSFQFLRCWRYHLEISWVKALNIKRDRKHKNSLWGFKESYVCSFRAKMLLISLLSWDKKLTINELSLTILENFKNSGKICYPNHSLSTI